MLPDPAAEVVNLFRVGCERTCPCGEVPAMTLNPHQDKNFIDKFIDDFDNKITAASKKNTSQS